MNKTGNVLLVIHLTRPFLATPNV